MSKSICGLECNECSLKESCAGCSETNGRPFGGECVIAVCCQSRGCGFRGQCHGSACGLKGRLISEINALGIDDMAEVTDLYALEGAFINLEYTIPNGQRVKLLDDKKVYLGNQIEKKNSGRCYGLAADESFLLVCEYGEGGTDAEIIIYKKRARQ